MPGCPGQIATPARKCRYYRVIHRHPVQVGSPWTQHRSPARRTDRHKITRPRQPTTLTEALGMIATAFLGIAWVWLEIGGVERTNFAAGRASK